MKKLQELKEKVRQKMIKRLHAIPEENLMKPVEYKVENVQLQTIKTARLVSKYEMDRFGGILYAESVKRDMAYDLGTYMMEQGYILYEMCQHKDPVTGGQELMAIARVATIPKPMAEMVE